MKTIYCPQTSIRYWLDRGRTILDTWGKGVDLIPNFNTEGYYKSTENAVRFLSELITFKPDYDWYVFSCDDVYVWTKRLEDELEKISKDMLPKCFCWQYTFMERPNEDPHSKCKGEGINTPIDFPSGSCFAINKSALQMIMEYLTNNPNSYACSQYADVSYGFWMRACKIPLIHDGRFDIEGKHQDDEVYLQTALTCHRMSCETVRRLHERWGK